MAAPAAPPVRVRWGLPDAALAWAAGLIGAIVVSAITIVVLGVPEGEVSDDVWVLLAGLLGQNAAVITVLALIAHSKDVRAAPRIVADWWASLRRNFGLEVRARDAGWLAAGVGLQIALGLALLPISEVYGRDESQSVVDSLDNASGVGLALFVVAVVALAPVAEELLFRGVLLRALLRRTTAAWAILISALAFAAVHPLGDPAVGSLVAVPALLGVGLVSGYLAVRSHSLSRSILLHAGFNVLTVVGILAS
jgi:hypothetical protein